ncbi:homing endonuclease [Streptococcus phage Javan133]|nr:homing endonuclease [Streptococcus phage Javan133]
MIKIDTSSKESMYRTFYHKTEWRKLREVAIKRDNKECVWCREREIDHD